MEYCGEVCTTADFEQRKIDYSKEKRRHYYFMSLKTDEVSLCTCSVILLWISCSVSSQILDATRKGNLSRFINHSCDPNCETQKASFVLFTTRTILYATPLAPPTSFSPFQWTVNGRRCIGFFSVRQIAEKEELTFDYQFQRFGLV